MTTSYDPALLGDGLSSLLNKTDPKDPVLQHLTNDQIIEIFRMDKFNMLSLHPEVSRVARASNDPQAMQTISVSTANRIYRCTIAKLSDDGQFLELPDGHHWTIGKKKRSCIFVRKGYRDHWEIIYHHFVVKKSQETVIVSGTPGAGKSVEGVYFLHKLFDAFAGDIPPVLYAESTTSNSSLVYFRGFVFTVPDHQALEDTLSYKVMSANGPVWHIYDSSCPGDKEGTTNGPQIIISSPGRADDTDIKSIRKRPHLQIYLPLPNLDEMCAIRSRLHDDPLNSIEYLSLDRMYELIDIYGCVPRTVFDFGNRKADLDAIWGKLGNANDVESMLAMVGSSVVDHSVVSGSFIHVVPAVRVSISNDDEDKFLDVDDYACTGDTSQSTVAVTTRKRKADDADVDEVGLSPEERINLLLSQYQDIVYTWGSDHIRDRAFQSFLSLSADRMMTVILRAKETELAGFRGLLLEPWAHKLLNETGVVGRFKDLETGKILGTKKLGPWKVKNIYRDHGEMNAKANVYNVPHKGNEAAIDSLVPYDGVCFQVTTSENHGINRPGFVKLIDTGIFSDFQKRKPKSPIMFIWVVEMGTFENFEKQDFHNKRKKVYSVNSPLRRSFKGVKQFALEVDLRRIYEFHHALKKSGRVNMTSARKVEALERVVKKIITPSTTGSGNTGTTNTGSGTAKAK